MKHNIRSLIAVVGLVTLAVTACTKESNQDNNQKEPIAENPSNIPEGTIEQSTSNEELNLSFNQDNYVTNTMQVDGKDVTYRAYERIVYVENPVNSQYQCMNIYVPEEYFNGGTIGSYKTDTAPIFLPNNVGGYMPSEPGKPELSGGIEGDASRVGLTNNTESTDVKTPNSILLALSKGYVVAAPGARGRTLEANDGTYTGKAPAAIVDLKAAVRYLHYNDDVIPGTSKKIISNGTSAGGALSTLLGATGNSTDYDSFLKDIGAAEASDAIYAVSSYCPITNLDHADMAYEWLFSAFTDYEQMNITNEGGQIKREKVSMTLTDAEKTNSQELKADFTSYVNSLNLRDENGNELTLDNEGNGSFKDYVKSYVIKSAQTALDQGVDLSKESWIVRKDNVIEDINFDGYLESLGRSKGVPAFDAIDLTRPENSLFGTDVIDTQHFTQFSMDKDTAEGTIADQQIIKMMNPMNYIGTDNVDVAKYWRIRHGEKDSDTAISTPILLKLALEGSGQQVDFSLPWGQGHGGDYDLDELFAWMDNICQNQ